MTRSFRLTFFWSVMFRGFDSARLDFRSAWKGSDRAQSRAILSRHTLSREVYPRVWYRRVIGTLSHSSHLVFLTTRSTRPRPLGPGLGAGVPSPPRRRRGTICPEIAEAARVQGLLDPGVPHDRVWRLVFVITIDRSFPASTTVKTSGVSVDAVTSLENHGFVGSGSTRPSRKSSGTFSNPITEARAMSPTAKYVCSATVNSNGVASVFRTVRLVCISSPTSRAEKVATNSCGQTARVASEATSRIVTFAPSSSRTSGGSTCCHCSFRANPLLRERAEVGELGEAQGDASADGLGGLENRPRREEDYVLALRVTPRRDVRAVPVHLGGAPGGAAQARARQATLKRRRPGGRHGRPREARSDQRKRGADLMKRMRTEQEDVFVHVHMNTVNPHS